MTAVSLSNVEAINRELVAVWERNADWIERRRTFENNGRRQLAALPSMPLLRPLQYPQLESDGIVFVGFNPSFSDTGWKTIRKRALAKSTKVPTTVEELPLLLELTGPTGSLESLIQWERLARDHLDFFAVHRRLSDALGLPCEHIDLFAWRHTNQAEVCRMLVEGDALQSRFSQEQLAVFDTLLALLKPKAVVITNAMAAEIYLSHRHCAGTFDVSTGHYWDTVPGAKPFPVLPAGMLTGQRALDRYSRQRLLWQLARSLPESHRQSWNPGTQVDLPRDKGIAATS